MTKLCLIGYGKMGKMIASMAEEHDCKVVSIIDPSVPGQHSGIDLVSTSKADVCIDFSHPSVVMDNIRNLLALHKNTVVGTTGWQEHLEEVKQLATDSHTGFLYGANFSIGMNLFGRVVDYAAALFDSFEAYDVYGFEMHHNQKADSPSGTALELANRVLAKSSRKTTVLWDKCDRKIKPEELHFASLRAGAMPGTHKIGFDSEADSVELSHQIRNRSSLALGAILAAKWLAGKQGFYSFNEMIDEILCK